MFSFLALIVPILEIFKYVVYVMVLLF
jgi:hypothetical protein